MLFNSLIFILFASLFFLIDKFIRKKINARLLWLTVASLFFYGWWDWRFIFLIVFSGMIDFIVVLAMEKYPAKKKLFLILSVLGNIGSLSIFKYSGFITHNIDVLLGLGGELSLLAKTPQFLLTTPIGISFYTFQSMSYTLDVYKGKLKPTKSLLHFFAYLTMFPQLVAGPVVRAKTMLPQLLKETKVTSAELWIAFQFIVKGYFKKMVIADNLAPIVTAAFSSPTLNESSVYWWGTAIAFSLQIYFDFAGYSDIARGLAKWMGYDFPDNFNHPFISTSLREFWQRWHISISTWFKDYVYIPLGGNKISKFRTYINIWITMLVSGLWHGAAWTFVFWGAIHAFFLSVEKQTNWTESMSKTTITKFIAWALVTTQVIVAFIIFRAESIEQAWDIIKIMFSFKGEWNSGWGINGTIFITIATARELWIAIKREDNQKPQSFIFDIVFYALLIAAIIFLRGNGSEFIYFQF
jgi:D-alanyl-lipoteichoic acid acyltransferase DltB (MBOAT superfamily)